MLPTSIIPGIEPNLQKYVKKFKYLICIRLECNKLRLNRHINAVKYSLQEYSDADNV